MNPFAEELDNIIEQSSRRLIPIKKGQTLGPSLSNMTMPNVKQVIKGNPPSKSNCYKIITFKSKDPAKHPHSSLAKTPALVQYEKDFFIQCNLYRHIRIEEYFEFEMDVYYPSQRSDLDNSLKCVLDCLQKMGIIKNDNLCVDIHVRKFLDKLNPRIEFTLKKAMQN